MRVLLSLTVSLALLAGCSDPSFELGRMDAAGEVELVEDSGSIDEDTAPEEDAGEPDTTIADSGMPVVDSGRFDTGKPDTYVKPDSYMPPMDSWVPPPMDSWVPPPMDSWVPPPMDSWVPPMDSYVPPMDSYSYPDGPITEPKDGGDKCSGVACIGTMTCCPYTGMCYEPACLGCCMPSSGGGG